MMDRWKGKVAVVTGASVGIGAAIAIQLADLGVIVVGLARRSELIEKFKTTGKIHAVKCDLSNEEDVLSAFRWIEENLGGADILINNAGVLKMSSLVEGDTKDWRAILELNVISLSICSREALKSMRTKEQGHIVNINSSAGHDVPNAAELLFGPYSASKFAVTSLTESLRIELHTMNTNIKITSISPGPVLTDMLLNVSKQMSKETRGRAKGCFIQTCDVVDAIVYTLGTRPGVEVKEIMIQPQGIEGI